MTKEYLRGVIDGVIFGNTRKEYYLEIIEIHNVYKCVFTYSTDEVVYRDEETDSTETKNEEWYFKVLKTDSMKKVVSYCDDFIDVLES